MYRLSVSVCLSVSQHLTSRISNRAINERAYSVECERQTVMPESTPFKRHAAKHERKKQLLITLAYSLSGFTTQRRAKGQKLPSDNSFLQQRHSALPKMTTPRAQLQREARSISSRAHLALVRKYYAPWVMHLVLFFGPWTTAACLKHV